MKESILNHKQLLMVDDEPDILTTLEEEILNSCPDSKIDKATNYEDAAELLKSKDYDLVVTVTGPSQTLRTRRKERVAGIWGNVDSREFLRVPSYLAILSNRPVEAIAAPDRVRRLQLGLDNYQLTQRVGGDFADTVPGDPFRAAFVRLEVQYGLYRQESTAVTFLTPTVFRAAVPIPSNVPTGNYNVDVKLFSGGVLMTRTSTALEVIKAGFEQYVADAARDRGLLYGLVTAFMALFIGWFGSVVFRRD